MKKLVKIIAVTLFLGATVAPAMAEGFYGALDVGQTTAADACTGAPSVFGCEDTATLFRIAGGYQFAPMWGLEVSYGNYGKASLISSLADWELNGLQVSGTGTFPLGAGFSLIGKLGVAQTTIKLAATGFGSTSATSTQMTYGIGAQYNFTESVAVRAQYEDLGTVGDANTTGESKVTILSAGVVFKF